jgi:hypothetical protein
MTTTFDPEGPWGLILTIPGAKRQIIGRFADEVDASDYLRLSEEIDRRYFPDYYAVVQMGSDGEPIIEVWLNNRPLAFGTAVAFMDPDLREQLKGRQWLTATPEQDYLNAYCGLHLAKYGEAFVLDDSSLKVNNPWKEVWDEQRTHWSAGHKTERMRVHGGWLYRTTLTPAAPAESAENAEYPGDAPEREPQAVALCFVAEPDR